MPQGMRGTTPWPAPYDWAMTPAFDVLVIGGGLVGTSLAIALNHSGLAVALVEAATPQAVAQPREDERNLALARASTVALQTLGVWPRLAGAATPIERLHISRSGEFGALRLAARDAGLDAFGAIVPARRLAQALQQALDVCTRIRRFTPAELDLLRPHLVNLTEGAFSRRGQLATTEADVAALFEHTLPQWLAAQPAGAPRRIVFWAHGGLVNECDGLAIAHKHVAWWKANGVFPVYFVWETGLFDAIGSLLANFLMQPSTMHLSERSAGEHVALYWTGAMVGRFIGAMLLRVVSPGKLLSVFALCAVTLIAAAVSLEGDAAGWALILVGLTNSVMFPTIFSLALEGLGEKSAQGSGLLCMAIVGGALVPLLAGTVADAVLLDAAFLIPAACYLLIAAFGWSAGKAPQLTPRAAVG